MDRETQESLSGDLAGKFVLGTVQFGLKYGLAEKKTDFGAVCDILAKAHDAGIRELDTAESYGDAHGVLARVHESRFAINSKVSSFYCEHDFKRKVHLIREELRVDRIKTMFVHDVKDLFRCNPERFNEVVLELKQENIVESFGVSVYWPREIENLLRLNFSIDRVQAPFNYFDRRFCPQDSSRKVPEIVYQFRSLFLQGVLLQRPSHRGRFFKKWSSQFEHYDKRVESLAKGDPLSFNLAVARSLIGPNQVVFGVDSAEQLQQLIVAAAAIDSLSAQDLKVDFKHDDMVELINPYLWGQK